MGVHPQASYLTGMYPQASHFMDVHPQVSVMSRMCTPRPIISLVCTLMPVILWVCNLTEKYNTYPSEYINIAALEYPQFALGVLSTHQKRMCIDLLYFIYCSVGISFRKLVSYFAHNKICTSSRKYKKEILSEDTLREQIYTVDST